MGQNYLFTHTDGGGTSESGSKYSWLTKNRSSYQKSPRIVCEVAKKKIPRASASSPKKALAPFVCAFARKKPLRRSSARSPKKNPRAVRLRARPRKKPLASWWYQRADGLSYARERRVRDGLTFSLAAEERRDLARPAVSST